VFFDLFADRHSRGILRAGQAGKQHQKYDHTARAHARPAPTSERPEYQPGELVDYIAQNGDTLPALAARFNTTVDEIMAANPIIPREATTMPPGLPMSIPIYYLPLWGTAYQSIQIMPLSMGPRRSDLAPPHLSPPPPAG